MAADRSARRAALALCAAMLLCTAPMHAQLGALRGTVTDAEGRPLIGANVALPGTMLGATSNAEGRYFIRRITAGVHPVSATMLGYERATASIVIAAGDTAVLDLRLRETPIVTDEVVVTAGRRAQSFEEIPVSISLFSARDIEGRGYTSLDQAMRAIPGVNMTESQVNVRGSSGYSRALGTRVLLLIDGAPMLAGDANEIKWDAVPMSMVERIEVVKGAGSALYGSSALGGVINIITKAPDRPVYRARLMSGFYGDPHDAEWKWWGAGPRYYNNIDVEHGSALDGFSYLLAAGARHNQGYRKHDDFLKWNLNGKAQYRLDPEHTLNLSAHFASDDRANWIYWKNLENALVPPDGTDLGERIHSTKLHASALYRATSSADFAWLARASMFRTAFDASSDTADYVTHPNDKTQSDALVASFEWQGTLNAGRGHTVTGGIDGNHTTVRSTTYGDRSGTGAALYLQDEWRPDPRWTISAGARVDLTSVDTADIDGQANPRLGLAYTPVHGTILRASFGRGFRAPSIAERFASASGGGLRTKPNPSLLSERSTSYEVGVKQELPLPASIDIALFWNEYNNLVEPALDPADGMIVFRNITRARIQGFEIGTQAAFFDGALRGAISYTYMYPRDIGRDGILKYRPRHLFNASGELRLFEDGFVAADFRHVGRIEEIDRELGVLIANADVRVAAYVTDVRAGWSFTRGGIPLTATFLVNNLFQYNYAEIVGNIAPIRNYALVLALEL